MIKMKLFRVFHGDDFAPCRAHRVPRSTFYSRILSISFLTLSTIAVQPSKAEAQSFFERRFQQRLDQRIERWRRDAAKMSDNQKEQLFETRRRWMTSTYEKRLALQQAGQHAFKRRRALQMEKTAGPNNSVHGEITLNRVDKPSIPSVSDWDFHPCDLP